MTWQKRLVRLDDERLWIGNVTTEAVLDFIPLNEIVKVSSKGKGKAKSKSFFRKDSKQEEKIIERTDSAGSCEEPAPRAASRFSGHAYGKHQHLLEHDGSMQEEEFLDHDDDDADDHLNVFAIYPIRGGHNAGKPTVLKMYQEGSPDMESEVLKWTSTIEQAIKALMKRERDALERETPLTYYQRKARQAYDKSITQASTRVQ